MQRRVLGVGRHNHAKWFLKDAKFGSLSDIYPCLPRIEFYLIEQVLGLPFSQMYIFFHLARSHLFGNAPHSRSWCWDAELCLMVYLKNANFGSPSDLYPCLPRMEFYKLNRAWGDDSRRCNFSLILLVFTCLEMRCTARRKGKEKQDRRVEKNENWHCF